MKNLLYLFTLLLSFLIAERLYASENMDYGVPKGFDQKFSDVSYGNIVNITYFSKALGTYRNSLILMPHNYSNLKKYPVLYLLHGIGGTETEWLNGNPDLIIGNLINSKEVKEMIVVMPNIRAAKDDSVPTNILNKENIEAFDNFINDLRDNLMPFINKNYSVFTDRENTAIAGLSMGGREALYIGIKMADKFLYVGAFSPAPGLIPYKTLNYEGQLMPEELTNYNNKHKVILLCSGTEDMMIGNIAESYHNVMEKNQVSHLYYTMHGGHDFSVWKSGLYNFVKRIFK